MLQRILELGPAELTRHDTSTLEVIAVSGSALPGPLAQRVMDAFGDVLYNLYGSTEVAWATVASPPTCARRREPPGARLAGRWSGSSTRTIASCRPDQTGRIFVGNELLFEGYTGGGNKARVGRADGHRRRRPLRRLGPPVRRRARRRHDRVGGENVFPSEVEDLLAGFPGVSEVAVVGVPDEEFGQRMRAFVVAEPGASLTGEQLKEHVHDNLARYKVPREIEFVDALPRNATGKVLKRQLT